jgi:lysophospholipase L1-like esterase
MRPLIRLSVLSLTLHLACGALAQPAASHPSDSRFQIPATDAGLPGDGPIRRYDWFRNLWQQRRSQWAEQAARDHGAVVFLGDSITQGWGEDLGRVFPGMRTANRGISGDTTRGVLIRLDEDVLPLDPSAVVLLIGTNDLEENASPETIVSNLKLILAKLKRHNAAMPVILCKVFPSSATKKRPADKIRKINELCAAAVKGDPSVIVLETWILFADESGDAKPGEFPDLLHPNATGYAKWSAALRPVFATLGFTETEMDEFHPEPGFKSLFNGRDLTGWGYRPASKPASHAAARARKNDPKAKPVRFDGMKVSNDGRYVAKNGRLIVTTPPEGRKVQQIWTTREFAKDFVLRLEFRATPYADSGVFIRGLQLQCRDYPLAGPYKALKNYRAQDWNELVITVKGTTAHCVCNGEVLEAALKIPDTGPIGLEGDCGQMEYRRIRLKELP